MVFLYILASVATVSIISLIGLVTFFMNDKILDKLLFYFVSFAVGALLASAFLDLIPESISRWGVGSVTYVLVGIISFFVIERFLYFYHCHKRKCPIHTFTYMNLFGDALHNIVDGMLIAASFLTSVSLGMITSLAVVIHEIPQEFSDFSILLYGGFKKRKALLYNFLISLASFAGALFVYFLSELRGIELFLIPFGAGGFIYLAATDLLPELHKTEKEEDTIIHIVLMLTGIAVIAIVTALTKS